MSDELYRVHVYYTCILLNVVVNLQIIIVLTMRVFLACDGSGGKGGGGVWKKMWKSAFSKGQTDGGTDEQKDEGDSMSSKQGKRERDGRKRGLIIPYLWHRKE